jgi:hypothetical protein
MYKFVRTGLKSNHDDSQWEIGEWRKTECKAICVGFNCSDRVIDALSYVKGEILCEVEAKGKHFTDKDKSTWESMRIVKAWHWKKEDSVAMAIFSAELVIDIFEKKYPDDKRPRQAIEAAKEYLKNPSKKTARAAARSARAAAYASAHADRAAYASAAAYASSAAARAADAAAAAAAAYAAAYAAYAADAAYAAADAGKTFDKIEAWIRERIKTLDEVKP